MTTLAPETTTTDAPTDHEDGLQHIVCACKPRSAMCGQTRPPTAEIEPYQPALLTCVVCASLDRAGCPSCGQ